MPFTSGYGKVGGEEILLLVYLSFERRKSFRQPENEFSFFRILKCKVSIILGLFVFQCENLKKGKSFTSGRLLRISQSFDDN